LICLVVVRSIEIHDLVADSDGRDMLSTHRGVCERKQRLTSHQLHISHSISAKFDQ
jgi:hypothetical protein